MNNQNDGSLFVFIFIGCPVLYLIFRGLPFLLFYVVPLIGSAFLVGHLWKAVCHARPIEYRRVAWLMAGSILVLILGVGFPQNEVISAKGKILLQSPWLYNAYNRLLESIEATINWSWLKHFRWILPGFLPPREYVPVIYDLRDLAWCLWLGICLGAPAIFIHYGQKKDQERIRKIEEDAVAKIADAEREMHNAHRENRRIRSVKDAVIEERVEELKKLKEMVAAMQTPIGPPPPPSPADGSGAPPAPKGVMDAL